MFDTNFTNFHEFKEAFSIRGNSCLPSFLIAKFCDKFVGGILADF
jgi:hypothetical protein